MKRRTFLKGAAVGGAAVGIGFDMSRARAEMRQFKIALRYGGRWSGRRRRCSRGGLPRGRRCAPGSGLAPTT